jgi:hypothetical protein
VFDPQNEDHAEIAGNAERLAHIARRLIAEETSIGDPNRAISARRVRLRILLRQTREFQALERLCAVVLGTTPGARDVAQQS